jgi:hypothetical protein
VGQAIKRAGVRAVARDFLSPDSFYRDNSYNGPMNVTRRNMARMLAATTAIPAVVTRADAQTPAGSDEETRSAHDLMQTNAQALAKVKLPMATEPAAHFKA